MTSKAQKIRVGAFAIAIAALAGFVVIVFGGLHVWRHSDHYRIVMTKSVMGLEEGAGVYVHGIAVGKVDDISLDDADLGAVVIAISVDRGTPVRTDTKASLSTAGLTGLKSIELSGGTRQAPALAPGGTIAEGVGTIDKLEKAAESIADRSDALLGKADRLMDNLTRITDPARFAAIDDVIAQARVTTGNLAAASGSLRVIAARADAFTSGPLLHVTSNADALIAQVRTMITANEAQVRAAVFDLRQASRSFKEMAREVRQKPSKLLFSSAPADRQLP